MKLNLLSCENERPDRKVISKCISDISCDINESLSNELTLILLEGDSIEIEIENGLLTVRSVKENDENDSNIYRGISYRKFNRKFTLADDIVVNDASLENGMLKIDLERIVPEEKKPRKITIK